MFVSVNYTPHLVKRVKVFCDEREITTDCFAASDKRGVALVYPKDENGKRYLDPNNPHRAKRDIVRGNIRIEIVNLGE